MIDIKKGSARVLKKYYQIDEQTVISLFDFGVLTEHNMKRILIREEFAERTDVAQKQLLKGLLADRYCVSISTIEKYLAGKPQEEEQKCT
jgi:hypothetical protein